MLIDPSRRRTNLSASQKPEATYRGRIHPCTPHRSGPRETVEDMQGFTCRRCDHLGVERCIAVREVSVKLASWLIALDGAFARKMFSSVAPRSTPLGD
jgi:hypothetical protein